MASGRLLRAGLLAAFALGLWPFAGPGSAAKTPGIVANVPGVLAFPGAEGYGAIATGWRGGDVVAVTSLADHGPGSLRACAENGGKPRVCIFRVGGTITLETPIYVGSNVYIAGQTAPGEGIQIRNMGGLHTPLIIKDVSDVVVRFLKIRPGKSEARSAGVDAVTVENARRVYLGNLSLDFATDETFNIHVSGAIASDITLADSLLALSLDHSSHPKGRHSKGALICSNAGVGYQCGRITLLRNLFAHHRDRNPDVKATSIGPVDIINNLFFDPISQFGEFYDFAGDARIAYVGNVALTGPSTIDKPPEAVQVFNWTHHRDVVLYMHDNIAGYAPGCHKRKVGLRDAEAEKSLLKGPVWPLSAVPMPASEVEASLLARAGDILPDGSHRDPLDQRVINDVLHCTGHVIDRVDQVGGWPELPTATAAADSDGDLLPDSWEAGKAGLDPQKKQDLWRILPGHRLSIVETWLAALAGDKS